MCTWIPRGIGWVYRGVQDTLGAVLTQMSSFSNCMLIDAWTLRVGFTLWRLGFDAQGLEAYSVRVASCLGFRVKDVAFRA